MTHALLLWIAFVLATGAIAYHGGRRQAIAFVLVAALTAPASLLTLGHATPIAPGAGQHTVLGARIDINEAIWVLLDAQGEPKFYRLPYSQAAANQLQAALDSVADGEGTVTMEMGQDGSPGFSEETPPAEETKRAEVPLIGG